MNGLPARQRFGKLKHGFDRKDFDFVIYNAEGLRSLYCHKSDCLGIMPNEGDELRPVPEDFVARKGMTIGFAIQETKRGLRATPWWFVEDPPPEPEPPPIDWTEYDGSSDVRVRRMFGEGRRPSRHTRHDVQAFFSSEEMRERVRMEHAKRLAERTDQPVLWGDCRCLICPERVFSEEDSPSERHPHMDIDSTFYIYRVVRGHSNCPLHSYGNPIEFYFFRENGEHPLDMERVTLEGICDDRVNPISQLERMWNRWLSSHGYYVDDED